MLINLDNQYSTNFRGAEYVWKMDYASEIEAKYELFINGELYSFNSVNIRTGEVVRMAYFEADGASAYAFMMKYNEIALVLQCLIDERM